jgi:hypothetical protein
MAKQLSVGKASRRPLNVYLDQSVYGCFLNEAPLDWRQAALARLLLDAQAKQLAQVWTSPTNVLETLQGTDLSRRSQIAKIILELIDARRMWHGNEFETIKHFMEFLSRCAPKVIRYPQFLAARVGNTRRIWLGGLALIACTDKLRLEPLLESLARAKTTSRLLHARFAVDPSNWLSEMIRTVEEQRVTTTDEFLGFDNLTLDQMETEIIALQPQFSRLTNHDLKRLNREREKLIRTYGAMEVGRILGSVFRLPFERQFVFDIPHLVERWSVVQARTGCKPLPREIVEAGQHAILRDPDIAQKVLQYAIYAATKIGIVPQTFSFEIILRELQNCINDRKLPTGGLIFDADHAAALSFCDVFVSRDATMTANAKTIAKRVAEETSGEWQIDVVGNEKQLAKALQSRKAKWETADVSVNLDIWGAD